MSIGISGGGAIGRWAFRNTRVKQLQETKRVNVGTIGHVDHGKTTLANLVHYSSPSFAHAAARVIGRQALLSQAANANYPIKGRGKGGKHKLRKQRGW